MKIKDLDWMGNKVDKKVALQLRETEPWREMAQMMSKCGFKYVAITLDEAGILINDEWESQVLKMREVFEKFDLKCVMTHAPYYHLLVSAEIRDEQMELAMLRSIKATKILGADVCAVHPRSVIIDGADRANAVDRSRSFEENLISFRPLIAECEKWGVKLGIENLMKYPYDFPYFYSYIVDDQIALIDALQSDCAVAIWDFGHANLVDEDHAERVRRLGGRIAGTHVHNNDGISDCHFPPFLPNPSAYHIRRTVNWEGTLAALRDTGFDGYLTLETSCDIRHGLESMVQYLYDNICELDEILR